MALPVPSVPSLVQASHQMALSVPYGFTFSPKDHELIYILYRKVHGNSLPVDEGLIEERELFGKEEPWEIFGRGTEKTRYFFVKLKKKGKSAGGSNFVRTVGKGTWKGQDGQILIKDQQGRTIGFKKNLVYKGKGQNTNGRWLMKEYHLHGVSLQPLPKLNDYVLCRIKKKDDGKKQNVHFDTEARSRCHSIGGNQDGESFGSVICEENSILGRKRPRIEYMTDYELPNLSVADATITAEVIDKERDQHMDHSGAENCVPALSEGISKSFMQDDDDAEIFRGLSPIAEKFYDEGFGGRLWTESEAEMGDPQESLQHLEINWKSLQDWEVNWEMFC